MPQTAGNPEGSEAGGRAFISAGIDVLEVSRVRRAVERHGERFLRRVFTGRERAALPSKNPHLFLALGFSLKEAVWKVLPDDTQKACGFPDIEVVWHRGQPRVFVNGVPFSGSCGWAVSAGMVMTTAVLFRLT